MGSGGGVGRCRKWGRHCRRWVILRLLPAVCCRLMTSADRNDLVPAQEKLEWVTPKISLMDAGDTESKIPAGKERTGPIGTFEGNS